jgi:hypothetical protein
MKATKNKLHKIHLPIADSDGDFLIPKYDNYGIKSGALKSTKYISTYRKRLVASLIILVTVKTLLPVNRICRLNNFNKIYPEFNFVNYLNYHISQFPIPAQRFPKKWFKEIYQLNKLVVDKKQAELFYIYIVCFFNIPPCNIYFEIVDRYTVQLKVNHKIYTLWQRKQKSSLATMLTEAA